MHRDNINLGASPQFYNSSKIREDNFGYILKKYNPSKAGGMYAGLLIP